MVDPKTLGNAAAVKKFFGNHPPVEGGSVDGSGGGGFETAADFMHNWKELGTEDKEELGNLAREALAAG